MTVPRLYPRHPEYYHGREGCRPYFEGWYFKHVSGDGRFALSVIPGISRGNSRGRDHSFVQVITGPPARGVYLTYPAEAFRWGRKPFFLMVGDNYFSLDRMMLRIDADGTALTGEIAYGPLSPPRRGPLSPSVMGAFAYLPGMQCNHGVLSLEHRLEGTLRFNGRTIPMGRGTGYIEKDWGSAFPSAWIWLQGQAPPSPGPGAAFTCSVASVPVGGRSFTGLIAVLRVHGREYRFATYNGGRVSALAMGSVAMDLQLRRGGHRLWVTARPGAFAALRAPAPEGMGRIIYESLEGVLAIRLEEDGRTLYSGVLVNAGIEWTDAQKLKIRA